MRGERRAGRKGKEMSRRRAKVGERGGETRDERRAKAKQEEGRTNGN